MFGEFAEGEKKAGDGRDIVQPCKRAQEVYQKDGMDKPDMDIVPPGHVW